MQLLDELTNEPYQKNPLERNHQRIAVPESTTVDACWFARSIINCNRTDLSKVVSHGDMAIETPPLAGFRRREFTAQDKAAGFITDEKPNSYHQLLTTTTFMSSPRTKKWSRQVDDFVAKPGL